jgi:hypothetical protein
MVRTQVGLEAMEAVGKWEARSARLAIWRGIYFIKSGRTWTCLSRIRHSARAS